MGGSGASVSLERRFGVGMVRHRAGAGDEAELASGGRIGIIVS